MKLYTEQKLIEAIIAGCDFIWDDTEEYYKGIIDIVNEFTPIEIPTDEQILSRSHEEPTNEYKAFQRGAIWMRDKILNK